MSDSSLPETVDPGAEQHLERPQSRGARAQCCRFCGRKNVGDVVDARGDVGRVHRACFIEWDRRQEALEAAAMVAMSMPDPREEWSERELEEGAGDSRAA